MVRSKVLQQANHYSRRYHKGASPKLSHCKKIRLEAGHGTQHSVWRRFAAALLPRLFGKNPRSHHKGATGRFELETNGFQFYAIANLDKTSLHLSNVKYLVGKATELTRSLPVPALAQQIPQSPITGTCSLPAFAPPSIAK